MIALIPLAFVVGMSMATVGVGGVLLTPALVWLTGIETSAAAATSTWCFLLTGIAGTLVYSRGREMPWRLAVPLVAGAAPAAPVGALVNHELPSTAFWFILALLTTASGAYNLRLREDGTSNRLPQPAGVVALGAVVGFGSALTGTGGAVLLVPLLLTLHVSALTAVAASQLVSVPIAAFGTAGYLWYGSVDFKLGTLLGGAAAIGVIAGFSITRLVRRDALHRLVSSALLGVGLLLFVTAVSSAL